MHWYEQIPALSHLSRYWSPDALGANVFIALHLVGALLLGMLVGYERIFRGRAAGMRTYGLVCMTSAGLTVLTSLPDSWFAGHTGLGGNGDLTRVVQGIVTGIGFLGAGVIMKEGFHVSGLSTAASIWTSSAIGILVGTGFYGAAILLAVVCTLSMEWGRRLERRLPMHTAMAVTLRFLPGQAPSGAQVNTWLHDRGYSLQAESLWIHQPMAADPDHAPRTVGAEWRFNATARDVLAQPSAADLAALLATVPGLASFEVTPYKS